MLSLIVVVAADGEEDFVGSSGELVDFLAFIANMRAMTSLRSIGLFASAVVVVVVGSIEGMMVFSAATVVVVVVVVVGFEIAVAAILDVGEVCIFPENAAGSLNVSLSSPVATSIPTP